MTIHGVKARIIESKKLPTAVALSSVTFGSYVRPISGMYKGDVCIWASSSALIPLKAPGELQSQGYSGLDSDSYMVEVLPEGSIFTVEITGKF